MCVKKNPCTCGLRPKSSTKWGAAMDIDVSTNKLIIIYALIHLHYGFLVNCVEIVLHGL
jgi:hypothetical protein